MYDIATRKCAATVVVAPDKDYATDVDALKNRWRDTLEREKQSFLEDLRRRAGAHVYDTIRRVSPTTM